MHKEKTLNIIILKNYIHLFRQTMTDFFKSAFGIFNSQNGGPNSMAGPGSLSFSASTNDFVGQSIMVGNLRLKVTKLLAEGGYAI
ncbi:hypothetical protein BpHYR1_025872, partial [Brachionus plicatilis]